MTRLDPCDTCEFRDSPLTCHARAVGHRAFCGDPKYRDYLRERTTGRPNPPPAREELPARPGPGTVPGDRPMPHPGPSPDGRVRVALLCPCLQMGGAEAWQLALARHTDPSRIEWVGCCVVGGEGSVDPAMRALTGALMPVTVGHAAARTLARRADVLVTWALQGIDDLLRGMERPPRVISTCHSPVQSPWGVDHNAMMSGVDRWVAVSELALPTIPEAARAAIPTSVIWNCVDPDRLRVTRTRGEMHARWGVPPGSRVAGYLGRLSEEKDPHAMRRMIGHLPGDWHAVLVGAGAERVDPHPRLHLVGTDPAVGDVLNAFDVLMVPSKYESFGLTIAEGLWMGVPVICPAVGLAKLIPGNTREIPIGADGPTLARAVLDDWDTYSIRMVERLGRAQDFAIQHLGPERFGREWTDLILATAAEPVPAGPGLMSLIGSFARAVIDHAVDGNRQASPEVRAERKAICDACPNLIGDGDVCALCGCRLNLKRSWASSVCPDKPPRWEREP